MPALNWGKPGKSSFSRRVTAADDLQTGGRLTAKAKRRRMEMFAEALHVLGSLPEPGEALHARLTGRCDVMVLTSALVELAGSPCTIRLATLGYNHRNLAEMLHLLDEGKASKITLLCGKFFLVHNRALFAASAKELAKRGSRAGYARTHVKVVTLDTPQGPFALEGSANLRTNGNYEQFCLTRDRQVHDWHAAFIEEQVDKCEGVSEDGKVEAEG